MAWKWNFFQPWQVNAPYTSDHLLSNYRFKVKPGRIKVKQKQHTAFTHRQYRQNGVCPSVLGIDLRVYYNNQVNS